MSEKQFSGFPHVIDTRQFPPKWIGETLFPLADQMERRELIGNRSSILTGKEMVSFFVGESLRTRASFEIAFRRLGGEVVFGSEAARKFSSISKGETIEDTIIVLNEYLETTKKEHADDHRCVIVLRTDQEGDAEKAAKVSGVPIINAGDGPGQHPTQALLDLYAIQKHLGRINGISIAMIGDLGSRAIHSLCYLLSKYQDIKMFLVSPKHLRLKEGLKKHLSEHHVKFEELEDVRQVAGLVDVFYQTRTQTNHGTKEWDRKDENHGFTIINKEVLSLAKERAVILHPLPCTTEIVRDEVDPDPRAIYIKTRGNKPSQVKGGLYIREALFKLILCPAT